jgi:TonB family protein
MRTTLLLLVTAACALAQRPVDAARQAMQRGELINAEQILLTFIDAQDPARPTALDQPLDLLAQVYRKEKKYAEAEEVQQRRINVWSAQLGENAVYVGRILGQMASVEQQAGLLDAAEQHSRRALAILTAAYPNQPPAAQAALDLADILTAEARPQAAAAMFALAEGAFGQDSMLAWEAAQKRAAIDNQPAPPKPPVYRIGKGVTAPGILTKAEPKYTEEARKAKLSGSIQLSIVVDATGAPTQIAVLRPLGMGLDEAAVQAVSQWKFKPATKDGAPVSVVAQIDVTLHLL